MLRTLLAFVPVAIVVTITPGPAAAMVVRSAARGGRRQALSCTVGNSIGVLSWALLAAAGLARSWRHRPRAYDLVWYSALAYAVARARHAFVEGPWARRAERLTGVVLIGLGARLAFERR